MKVLIMSDSHGNTAAMLRAVRMVTPELILHLGDHEHDCAAVGAVFPEIPLRAVRGNCDRSDGLDNDEFVIAGKKVFMTHGHHYGVKLGLDSLLRLAASRDTGILLFGHTHNPYYAKFAGLDIMSAEPLTYKARRLTNPQNMLVINPGSIGRASNSGKKTYAVLEIENGDVNCSFYDAGDGQF